MQSSSAWELVRGIEPMSFCDWPGRLTAVLFFGGCNLRCPHCHNADLAWRPEDMPPLPAASVRRFVASHGRWLDGLVLSGGEPTLVPGLADFAAELAGLGLPVKIDTNGLRPDVMAAVFERYPEASFSVDVKAPLAKYQRATGGSVDAAAAGECLAAVFDLAGRHPGRIAFRTTLVPELDASDVGLIREGLPSGCAHTIQPFRPTRSKGEERRHAHADSQTRRMSGNMVHPAHRPCDPEGPQGQRYPGPAFGHAPGSQGRSQA
jgi:pyruvate formate lyase activating enzyme